MEAAPVLPADPVERLARLGELRARSQAGAGVASLDLLAALLQQVPAPPAPLFAGVDDTPAAPDAADAQAAAAWAAAAAAQLQLAAELAAGLGARELGLEALVQQAAGEPPPAAAATAGGGGGFIIEELDADAAPSSSDQPSADLPVAAVLAASLYGADGRLARPWAAEQPAAAAAALLRALGAKLADWQRQQQQHGRQEVLLQEAAMPGRAGRQQLPAEVQQLVALAAPAGTARLRPVVAAQVEHGRHRTARLEPYTGPSNYERCVAAGQLAWLARQLSGRHLSTAAHAVLPAVQAGIQDPFPPVQACCLWALQHLAAEGRAEDLRPHARAALEAAKGAVAGGNDASWPAAAAAAIAVVSRLEGGNPHSSAYHEVMSALLDQGELGAHQPEKAAAWLAAAPPLFPRLGLQLASHFARLMPLLLGWALAPWPAVRAAALRALLGVLRLTWPRAGAHAALTWRVLRRVHEEERLRRRVPLPAAPASSAAASSTAADVAEDAALALWCAAGTNFQVQLMTSKEGQADELLQAVVQRLEEAAAAEQEEHEGGATAAAEQAGTALWQGQVLAA
ncbi:hypothetical protein ABPG75_003442 [Micractinium tetrahymenae]